MILFNTPCDSSASRNGQAVDWNDLESQILDKLDVVAEYVSLGLRITSDSPSASGWLACRSMDREDKHPSAAINVETGFYCDHGSNKKASSFWKFVLDYGQGFNDYMDVLRHYGDKVGVKVPGAQRKTGNAYLEHRYIYCDEQGEVLYSACRYRLPDGGKRFELESPDGKGGWRSGLRGARRVLYRLPELVGSAEKDEPAWIVEGEKNADDLAKLGLIATCNPMGAGGKKWLKEYTPYFADRKCFVLPDNDDSGRKHAETICKAISEKARVVRVVKLPDLTPSGDVSDWLGARGTLEDLLKLASESPIWEPEKPRNGSSDAIFREMSAADLGIEPLSKIEERPVIWLWKYMLERGAMALLAGDAGLGKSQFQLATVATVSTGRDWPDGSGASPVGNVVIVSAEDRPESIIRPRLMAMGADLSRITIVKARCIIRQEGREPQVHFASFQDIGYWKEIFRRIPDVLLFIVDPLPSYLGRGVNDSKNCEIREVLETFIHEIVEPNNFCMYGDTHLNKNIDTRTPLYRVTGSIAYGAIPRNVHFIARDPEDPERRLFVQCKCNAAPGGLPALAFKIEPREITSSKGEKIETAIPVFEKEPVVIDLAEVVKGNGGGGRGGKRGPENVKTKAVAEWLFKYLKERPGATLLAEIFDAAGAAGLVGSRKEDGRWSGSGTLYDASKLVETLDPPLDGKRIESITARIGNSKRKYTHWLLCGKDSVF